MQVRVERGGTLVRVQRDGPSPSEQAQEAAAQQLRAEITERTDRLQRLVESGAEQTAAGRMAVGKAREQLLASASKLRELEQRRHEQAMEDAAQDMAASALAQVGTTEVPPTPPFPVTPGIPPGAVDISIAFFVCTAAAIILFPLMRAFGRILERRAAPPQRLAPELESQLHRMEQAIETVAVEVERISEGQRFTAKLLSEREKVDALRP
ncbi:MAG TPA: hypothetical protein VFT96_11015 [Gemmatimonadaceae bacterium]|nr:hypothetical protein [Gemmatimonadaceae bacterium]